MLARREQFPIVGPDDDDDRIGTATVNFETPTGSDNPETRAATVRNPGAGVFFIQNTIAALGFYRHRLQDR